MILITCWFTKSGTGPFNHSASVVTDRGNSWKSDPQACTSWITGGCILRHYYTVAEGALPHFHDGVTSSCAWDILPVSSFFQRSTAKILLGLLIVAQIFAIHNLHVPWLGGIPSGLHFWLSFGLWCLLYFGALCGGVAILSSSLLVALYARRTSDRSFHISHHSPILPRPPEHNRLNSAIRARVQFHTFDMIARWHQELVQEQREASKPGQRRNRRTQRLPRWTRYHDQSSKCVHWLEARPAGYIPTVRHVACGLGVRGMRHGEWLWIVPTFSACSPYRVAFWVWQRHQYHTVVPVLLIRVPSVMHVETIFSVKSMFTVSHCLSRVQRPLPTTKIKRDSGRAPFEGIVSVVRRRTGRAFGLCCFVLLCAAAKRWFVFSPMSIWCVSVKYSLNWCEVCFDLIY